MNTPVTSPLMEDELRLFYGKGCEIGAIFVKNGTRFAGPVFKLEYGTGKADKVVTSLTVTFYWVLEVSADFLEPVTGKIVENAQKEFLLPHKILRSCRPDEVLTCCAGADHEDKIKITKKLSHVLALTALKETNEQRAS